MTQRDGARPVSASVTAGTPFRLSGRGSLVVAAVLGLIVIFATDQILPASSARQAELRVWLAARATGLIAFGLLTAQILMGLVLSHPTNKTTWKLSKRLFPWHDHLWVFVTAFVAAHVLSLLADPKSGVDFLGAVMPGMSEYRSVPVAAGTMALYALLVTALTARYTRLLPPGVWLRLHRLSLIVFALAWAHGALAGTDTPALRLFYVATGVVVTLAGSYRYWIVRRSRTVPAALEVVRS